MENLLYIAEIQKKFQLGLLSILPTHYTKKLNMIPFDGIKQVMDYVLKNQGQNQKVEVISDGARTLLRQNSRRQWCTQNSKNCNNDKHFFPVFS